MVISTGLQDEQKWITFSSLFKIDFQMNFVTYLQHSGCSEAFFAVSGLLVELSTCNMKVRRAFCHVVIRAILETAPARFRLEATQRYSHCSLLGSDGRTINVALLLC